MANSRPWTGIASVARKEFLHVLRDRRVMVLILVLPPLLTFIFGHAFETSTLSHIPASLQDRDGTAASRHLVEMASTKETFDWKKTSAEVTDTPDLLREQVDACLIIPAGWEQSLKSGDPLPLRLVVDGSDTTTADQVVGNLQAILGDFQLESRQAMIDDLPEEVIELGKQIPVEVRKQFTSAMTPWSIKSTVLYNPKELFIDYIIPGVIGLILQLLTVTLMASTVARERESGTLYQMMITSLRRSEIVIGKVLPYLAISLFLILMSIAVAAFHFGVKFQRWPTLALICFLFLVCSLGLGLLISAFSSTQTQAIQFAVFYLLPVFPLSGAFAPLEQLPGPIQWIAQTFPLTHFCHAFRMINLRDAPIEFIGNDLLFLIVGAILTCAGAGYFLRRIQE